MDHFSHDFGASNGSDPAATPVPRPPGRRPLRWALNLWLVGHLSAILIAPASVSPSSDLIASGWLLFRPYLQSLYLNHGHHFFAPEPAESTLLSFVAYRADGTTVAGRVPNLDLKPRLLYHRHFMLTEHMAQAPKELRQQWYRSYAMHLGRKYAATRVSLTRQTHYLPTMAMVRDGIKLDDPASYEEEPLGEFRCDEH